jgi:enoyl-CoA hydratase
MSELVHYESNCAIASIAIDDGKLNVFSIAMLQALHAALDEAERERIVTVIRGRAGCFSAGFDLKTFGEGTERVVEMLRLGATLAERVLAFPAPVIVACSGHAVAAGAFLTLAADARIGVEGPFQLGLNEVRIGLTVPWFVIELARQRLAGAHFDAAVVSARMHTPTEAVTAGLLDRVVPVEQFEQAVAQTAGDLAQLDIRAHAASKLRARADALKRVRQAIETELTVERLSAAQSPA